MTGLSQANVFGGGGTIDNNGKAITIGQAFLTPTGNGVGTVAVSGGTGYVAPPWSTSPAAAAPARRPRPSLTAWAT